MPCPQRPSLAHSAPGLLTLAWLERPARCSVRSYRGRGMSRADSRYPIAHLTVTPLSLAIISQRGYHRGLPVASAVAGWSGCHPVGADGRPRPPRPSVPFGSSLKGLQLSVTRPSSGSPGQSSSECVGEGDTRDRTMRPAAGPAEGKAQAAGRGRGTAGGPWPGLAGRGEGAPGSEPGAEGPL